MSDLTNVDVDFYRRNGYVVVKSLFDAAAIARIKAELSALAAQEGQLPPGSFVLEEKHEEIRTTSGNPLDWILKIDYPAMARSAYLMSLFRDGNSAMVRACGRLAGEEQVRLVFISTFAKPPRGGSEIPWHQDQALWDLWMQHAVSGWIALDRTTDENGALQIVPQSHTWGMAPHRQYPGKLHESICLADFPHAKPVKLYMEPGDVVFFGGKTWHASDANHSSQRRLGVPIVYAGEQDLKAGLDCDAWLSVKLKLERPMTTLPMSTERRTFYEERPLVTPRTQETPTTAAAFRARCSQIIAGMWHLSAKLDASGFERYLAACMEQGVNTFDHADIYGAGESERRFGAAWRTLGIARESMILISKCGIIPPRGSGDPFDQQHYDTSRPYIVKAVDGILQRLQTEYLDLLLIHRYDPLADFSQIAEAFDSLQAAGKIRAVGVSNYPPHEFQALNRYLGGRLIANQLECSVFCPGPFMDGSLDILQADGLLPMAWSPLGGNFDARLAANPRLAGVLRAVAKATATESLTMVALRWLITHPSGILPVIGTSQPSRMIEAVRAAEGTCSRKEFFAILSAALGHPMP